ncbi:hypothetical protein AVEN_139456-1 [Araneus ventricosus]|uniref:Uncharacterized protein n=1 Tax=Araneus ventricosus TaxID=182803 RepID=A0A4Y2J0Z0_ARAVE|nr:hypothetical protein AVEN_139456-1 [Araneus ventricosus]
MIRLAARPYTYKKFIQRVYGERSPTNMSMYLFHEYSRKHKVQVSRKTALVLISNTRRQHIPIITETSYNSAQCLTADQFALRTEFQSDSFSRLSIQVFIDSPTGHDVTWNGPEESPLLGS